MLCSTNELKLTNLSNIKCLLQRVQSFYAEHLNTKAFAISELVKRLRCRLHYWEELNANHLRTAAEEHCEETTGTHAST